MKIAEAKTQASAIFILSGGHYSIMPALTSAAFPSPAR